MAWDLTLEMEDRPGALAEAGEVLGDAGINLAGGSATVSAGIGTVHVLVEGDDPAPARKALADAGIDIQAEREVLVVEAPDEPGALGEAARELADSGINIEVMYIATDTRLVFGVDDLEAARQVLEG